MIVRKWRWCRAALVAVAGVVVMWGASAAGAAVGKPWWQITSVSRPTTLKVGESGQQLAVIATNIGDGDVAGEGAPVVIEDVLPGHLEATRVEAIAGGQVGNGENRGPVVCSTKPVSCSFEGMLPPFDPIEVRISVSVKAGAASGEENTVNVSGGGAAAATVSHAITVGEEPSGFGVDQYSVRPEEEGGEAARQAGSHPFQVTGTVIFNQGAATGSGHAYEAHPVGMPKVVNSLLPAGMVGDPTSIAKCSLRDFLTEIEGTAANKCAPASAIGVASVIFSQPAGAEIGVGMNEAPIFNLEPAVGEPARFGFIVQGQIPVILDTSVRTGSDYGITLGSANVTQTGSLIGLNVTFWGVPGDSRHNAARGWDCLRQARQQLGAPPCVNVSEGEPPAFLDLPTACEGPLPAVIEASSWEEPKPVGQGTLFYGAPIAGMQGCNRLSFAPEVKVSSEVSSTSSPVGLDVDVHDPQNTIALASGLTGAALKKISLALPEGFAVNAASAGGLAACSEGEIGYLASASAPPQQISFTPGVSESICPAAAKVGTVRIKTPLLPAGQDLTGSIYVATQGANPFGSLVALYLVAEDPVSGVVIKQAGEVALGKQGQITGTFANIPEVPFEDAEVNFFPGERAAVSTPASCSTYSAAATFTPWSGGEVATSTSQTALTSGPHGTPCPGSTLPFKPSDVAGSGNVGAGKYTTFTSTISRNDGEQALGGVSEQLPPGVSGVLTGVPLCAEGEANAGACPASTLIGESTVTVGVGGQPLTVKGGHVYLTGPYNGAPFGLSIVSPAKAGPFDLESDTSCDCVVVRARLLVNPYTAVLTVQTDTSGPHVIPRIIKGVPLEVRRVVVTVTKEHFTFNPTDCAPKSITVTTTGAEGATSSSAVPFQVTNCAALTFAPHFEAQTSGKTSRLNGASLKVKLSYPSKPFGTQTNIAVVHAELPRQLPSRITTLRKACLAAVFERNPASCPPQSIIGHATVTTPVLPVPLTGPAYFVSHGGEAFPSLTIVLQGYGVTIDLVGATLIRHEITSTTFKTTPDVPFKSFELTLPEGPYSALGTVDNLCKAKLTMPMSFTAQDEVKTTAKTPIKVTGCPKARKPSKAHKASRRKPKVSVMDKGSQLTNRERDVTR